MNKDFSGALLLFQVKLNTCRIKFSTSQLFDNHFQWIFSQFFFSSVCAHVTHFWNQFGTGSGTTSNVVYKCQKVQAPSYTRFTCFLWLQRRNRAVQIHEWHCSSVWGSFMSSLLCLSVALMSDFQSDKPLSFLFESRLDMLFELLAT